jgi:hypothetical protein
MIRTARWVLVLAAVAASINVVAVVDQGSHSVSDTLYGSVVYLVVIWAMAGIALLILNRRNA